VLAESGKTVTQEQALDMLARASIKFKRTPTAQYGVRPAAGSAAQALDTFLDKLDLTRAEKRRLSTKLTTVLR